MQCYEFEAMCHVLFDAIRLIEPSAKFDMSQLADILADHEVATFAQLQTAGASNLAEVSRTEMLADSAMAKAA